jgi:Derlin-2/3
MEVFNFFFQDSPKVTTFLTLTCLSISILTWFEILSPLYLYLNFELIFKKYQFWRLFTSFFYYGDIGLSFIFHMILFFRNSKFLENSVFKGNAADYIFFLLFSITYILIISFFVGFIFPASSLSFAMTYYWGRKSKNVVVQFMGIFNLRAPYLPWFYLIFSFLLDSEFKYDLVGMIVGHFFSFLKIFSQELKN